MAPKLLIPFSIEKEIIKLKPIIVRDLSDINSSSPEDILQLSESSDTMYKLLFLTIFGLVVASPITKEKEDVRIVGGEDIDITGAPYQVSIVYAGRHSCGGSIIADDLVLTAAHCVTS
ncbi:PREDICTED: vitellin-degrading protease-like [Papilio xuthus]|uniref:Vitellin-degrading protease-like n=1 Tax=Papilio xuthus TaxID=66420 RepID=A0AAJ6ZAP1_PAPXU|nr:PREDICTED: vitellin-degrading protease-like [Papilio xuthus]